MQCPPYSAFPEPDPIVPAIARRICQAVNGGQERRGAIRRKLRQAPIRVNLAMGQVQALNAFSKFHLLPFIDSAQIAWHHPLIYR